MALNDDQLLAVRADPRVPLLIKAGPGSGKTLTLLHRILFLLPTLLPTENILLLTFSKAAVKEMQTRLLPHMDDKKNHVVRVSTFHSFCYQVIRDHYSFLHFTSSPKVISSKERKNVLLYAIKNCSSLNPDLQSLDKTQMNALLRLINELKRATNVDKFISERNCKEFVKDIFVAYQKRIKDLNYIEFADMVPLADELFKAHPSTLSQYVQKYKYVLCDEFQDTNAPQRRILFSLAPEGRISVVGDPNQLIYAFQGADLANFEEFEKTFSNISSAAVNAVTLSVNYRSTAAIVRVTNEILRCRAESESLPLASNMRASESNGPGSPVLIVECLGGEEAEWSFILSHIESLLSRGGSSASNIAVLCRDNDTASRIGDFLSARGGLGVQLSLEDKSGPTKLIGLLFKYCLFNLIMCF